jgi:hypothetical protein
MQDVDCIAEVERLPQPARGRGVCVQDKPLRLVPCTKGSDGIGGYLGRRRDVGQQPAIRAMEVKLTVRLSVERESLLMDSAMVAATEQGEIRERGRAAVRPVTDVVALPEPHAAAREAATAVAMMQRSPESAGGIVRVRAPTSTVRPSGSCRITTRLASQARR